MLKWVVSFLREGSTHSHLLHLLFIIKKHSLMLICEVGSRANGFSVLSSRSYHLMSKNMEKSSEIQMLISRFHVLWETRLICLQWLAGWPFSLAQDSLKNLFCTSTGPAFQLWLFGILKITPTKVEELDCGDGNIIL